MGIERRIHSRNWLDRKRISLFEYPILVYNFCSVRWTFRHTQVEWNVNVCGEWILSETWENRVKIRNCLKILAIFAGTLNFNRFYLHTNWFIRFLPLYHERSIHCVISSIQPLHLLVVVMKEYWGFFSKTWPFIHIFLVYYFQNETKQTRDSYVAHRYKTPHRSWLTIKMFFKYPSLRFYNVRSIECK